MSYAEESLRKSIRVKEQFLADGGAGLLEQMAGRVVAALKSGRRMYLCGNGGSAADAQHVAGELVGRFLMERAPLPCVALTTDTSVLTCLANDYSFEDIFERQVNALVSEGDILVAISTSGNSVNVLKAVAAAKAHGATVLGLSGRGGGRLAQEADLCLVAPADDSPAIQELHIACLHILCALVERGCFG